MQPTSSNWTFTITYNSYNEFVCFMYVWPIWMSMNVKSYVFLRSNDLQTDVAYVDAKQWGKAIKIVENSTPVEILLYYSD